MDLSNKMWISKIEISGLAGSDKVIKCELNSDVNVFYGVNGSGKTSLLKILNSAATNNSSNLREVPFKSAKLSINFYGIYVLERSIVNRSFEQSVVEPVKNVLSPLNLVSATPAFGIGDIPITWHSVMYELENNKLIPYRPDEDAGYILPHQYLPTYRLYRDLAKEKSWEQRQFTEQELEQNFAKLITDLWKDYNYSLSGSIAKAQAQGLASILRDVWATHNRRGVEPQINLEQAFDKVKKFLNRQGLKDILKSFEDFQARIKTESYLVNIINDINKVEETIEGAMIPKMKLQDLIKRLYGERVKLNFEDKQITAITKDSKEIALGALSSGQKQLLMIFLTTLMASYKPILIDEPEISMHVEWQSELIDNMRQLTPSAQLIIATHSPEISASVDDGKLFLL
jgi:ABC-type lipoprotein export system ATPase subunit